MTDQPATIVLDVEPVHAWFDLTYANYYVCPRSILQSLPLDLQRKFVDVVREIEALAGDDLWPGGGYRVTALDARGRFTTDPCPNYDRGRTRVQLRERADPPHIPAEHQERELAMQFEIYEAADGWRWRLKAGNGLIIADSGEAYVERADCEHGIALVKRSGEAPIEEAFN